MNKSVKTPGKSGKQGTSRGKHELPPMQKGIIKRLLIMLFRENKAALIFVFFCIILTAISATVASLFMNQYINHIKTGLTAGWDSVRGNIIILVVIMAVIYIIGLIASFLYTRILAVIVQKFQNSVRKEMFKKMQSLPLRYFDTHPHGDIMSHYTNDIDTTRELISRSIPQIINSALIVSILIFNMLYLSIWMTLVVGVGIAAMFFVTKTIGGNSSKYFFKQQKSLAAAEGFVEEMISGQKVVKVFCHEDKSIADFEKINNNLCADATNANKFANILMPIMGNIGNLTYVLIAFVGGIFIVGGFVNNVSLSGQAMGVAVVVPFLQMIRQFTNNVSQASQQINSIVMAKAGAARVFGLLDQTAETDSGYVTLVNAKIENKNITEADEKTGIYAWKHPHTDGSVTYTRLLGDVVIEDMDFGYIPEKAVLKDINIFANPGEKIAFVGATGAGKTTITNLINRFYEVETGKIRYDGINIQKIKKADLRRSLGIVLQDTNLFTGSVMDNIRYGNLDASDEECIAAAKLAGADDFITRLPAGYDTPLTSNGANLSQGQRQLISIARAAVADPPCLILDEATSSIDTRTEQIVQRGMDALMSGRTVFVIAHRLSTVRNADVIMVLEQGEIIERGNHEFLVAKKGKYYQLYTGAFELE